MKPLTYEENLYCNYIPVFHGNSKSNTKRKFYSNFYCMYHKRKLAVLPTFSAELSSLLKEKKIKYHRERRWSDSQSTEKIGLSEHAKFSLKTFQRGFRYLPLRNLQQERGFVDYTFVSKHVMRFVMENNGIVITILNFLSEGRMCRDVRILLFLLHFALATSHHIYPSVYWTKLNPM